MNKLTTFFTVFAGWSRIVLFPVMISLILSLLVYLTMPAIIGFVLSVFLCLCGLVTGIVMATNILRKRGIAAFLPKPEEEAEPEQPGEEGQSPDLQ